MYIRQTETSPSASGSLSYTYRLVVSERVGDKVRQCALLRLSLFSLGEEIEKLAQHDVAVGRQTPAGQEVGKQRVGEGGAGQGKKGGKGSSGSAACHGYIPEGGWQHVASQKGNPPRA